MGRLFPISFSKILDLHQGNLPCKMWKYFTQVGNKKWVNIVDDLLYNYNNTYHRSIKMTPVKASKKQNETKVYKNLYTQENKTKLVKKFKVGDKVRISKYKGTFDKGYLPNWTTELFTVSKVSNTDPVTYRVIDDNDDEIEGSFYETELVKFDKQDQDYEVEDFKN